MSYGTPGRTFIISFKPVKQSFPKWQFKAILNGQIAMRDDPSYREKLAIRESIALRPYRKRAVSLAPVEWAEKDKR